jgi:3-phosphoshikimate 1-carboxyvinyltransferase
MDRVAKPLREMGASISGVGERELPPLSIEGRSLHGIDYTVPVPSAQVKSAVLLAGLFADGPTTVRERVRTRTTTEDMLLDAGVNLNMTSIDDGRMVTVEPGRPLARRWTIPTDPSQAAFFCVLGLIGSDAVIEVRDVEASAERIGFVHVLRRMNAQLTGESTDGVVTLVARTSSLTATTILAEEIPSVDEAPILTIAAAAASGTTVFKNMGELRLKESDRFEGCLQLARLVGATAWSEGDDFYVTGLGSAANFKHFSIDAGLDHRIVMSSAVAGSAGQGCVIDGVETVASSYPEFFRDLDSLS